MMDLINDPRGLVVERRLLNIRFLKGIGVSSSSGRCARRKAESFLSGASVFAHLSQRSAPNSFRNL